MLWRFRIALDPDLPDDATGWVVAQSELDAREMFGCPVDLAKMPGRDTFGLNVGTIIQTGGKPLARSRPV